MRCELVATAVIGLSLIGRDCYLAATGGGVTPRWLLNTELAAAVAVTAAVAGGFRRNPDAWRRPRRTALGIALAIHAVRLSIYLSRRKFD